MRSLQTQLAGFGASEVAGETVRPPLPFIAGWLGDSQFFHALTRRLTAAGLNVTPQEFFAFALMTAMFLFAAGAVLTRHVGYSLLLGGTGAVSPFLVLNVLRNRRKLVLERQLADALILVSSSMQAGYGFLQGIRVASEQLPSPIADEFERVAFNVSLGMALPAALQGMGERVQSYEFDILVSAITTQIESGGSVTGILESIAETIRSRNALRDEIRAMTAQGKMSGIVLSLLPIALLVGLSFINPQYANVLYRDKTGQNILKGAALLQVVGWAMVRKILNVRL
jgi:tight adherence protein B